MLRTNYLPARRYSVVAMVGGNTHYVGKAVDTNVLYRTAYLSSYYRGRHTRDYIECSISCASAWVITNINTNIFKR
jgi:hypothetical protein